MMSAKRLLDKPAAEVVLPTNKTNKHQLRLAVKDIECWGLSLSDTIFIDIDGGRKKPHWSRDIAPCLTRSRAGQGGWWVSSLNRRMTTAEMLRFMGMPVDRFKRQCISERQFRLMIGNAWCILVTARITAKLLLATGLVSPLDVDVE